MRVPVDLRHDNLQNLSLQNKSALLQSTSCKPQILGSSCLGPPRSLHLNCPPNLSSRLHQHGGSNGVTTSMKILCDRLDKSQLVSKLNLTSKSEKPLGGEASLLSSVTKTSSLLTNTSLASSNLKKSNITKTQSIEVRKPIECGKPIGLGKPSLSIPLVKRTNLANTGLSNSKLTGNQELGGNAQLLRTRPSQLTNRLLTGGVEPTIKSEPASKQPADAQYQPGVYESKVEWDIPTLKSRIPERPELSGFAKERIYREFISQQDPATDPKLVAKKKFVNAVSGSLLRSPNFKDIKDKTRVAFIQLSDQVALFDPEFILKVAVYTRLELGIRTTANFLLAYAAYKVPCRPFLQKYFKKAVALPSDWIEVAEVCQSFDKKPYNFKGLPSALRRVLVEKFPDFDKYQLAKYNKGAKKPARKPEPKTIKPRTLITDPSSDDEEEVEEKREQKTYTLKQLIRQLHISKPVEHVMCLVGKKYPEDFESFYLSRLPGTFEEERAGKRMKLPIPETWETQVSMNGNKGSVWESLIDHKKLPFMAMLRNIRNMLKAGISEKHHQWVIKKLTDEYTIANSKQFPFRFFSAFKVLDELEKDYQKHMDELIKLPETEKVLIREIRRRPKDQQGEARKVMRIRQRQLKQGLKYEPTLIERYRKALEKSIQLATSFNISPIAGRTLVLCNAASKMCSDICGSARGLGEPKTMVEIALLLGLMCKRSCEDCDFNLYGSDWLKSVEWDSSGILAQTKRLKLYAEAIRSAGGQATLPETLLKEYVSMRKHVDTVIIISNGEESDTESKNYNLKMFLQQYRHLVNPELLFAYINLDSRSVKVSNDTDAPSQFGSGHINDVHLAGFSDQLLRYIAERGDSGQILHIDNIDLHYDLRSEEPSKEKNNSDRTLSVMPTCMVEPPRKVLWRTVRVFISSTFRDMHGERDILTRFVFPELRSYFRKLLDIIDVDLRWGVTEHQASTNTSVEICLEEVQKCDYFIAMIGERRGRLVEPSEIPSGPVYNLLRKKPARTMTGLEIQLALALEKECFIFARDSGFIRDVPSSYRSHFEAEDDEAREITLELQNAFGRNQNGLRRFTYTAEWGGVVDNKPVCKGLDEFAAKVHQVIRCQLDQEIEEGETSCKWYEEIENAPVTPCVDDVEEMNISELRIKLATKTTLDQYNAPLKLPPIVVVSGDRGTGKSVALDRLTAVLLKESEDAFETGLHGDEDGYITPVTHVRITPGSDIMSVFAFLCRDLHKKASLGKSDILPLQLVYDYDILVTQFHQLLKSIANIVKKTHQNARYTVIMDGVNYLSDLHRPHKCNWLPADLPEQFQFVMGVTKDTEAASALLDRVDSVVHEIEPLSFHQRQVLLSGQLGQYGKTLSTDPFDNQMRMLINKKSSGNPLYLKLCSEEIRLHGVFEEVSKKLNKLPETLPKLIAYIFKEAEAELGKKLVRIFSQALYCLPSGTSLTDSAAVVTLMYSCPPSTPFSELIDACRANKRRIPPLVISRLIRRLHLLIAEPKDGKIQFSWPEVREMVENDYMRGASVRQQTHSYIAAHNMAEIWSGECPAPWDDGVLKYYADVISHLKLAQLWNMIETLLSNLEFIHVKVSLGLATSLAEDYSQEFPWNRPAPPQWSSCLDKVQIYNNFVRKHVQHLSRYTEDVLQLALTEDGTLHNKAEHLLHTQNVPHFVLLNRDTNPTNKMLISELNMPVTVTSVSVSKDGRELALGCSDSVVKIFDMNTLKEMYNLRGHSHQVEKVSFCPDNKLVSCSKDGVIILWNLKTGSRISQMKKHQRGVKSVAVSSDAILSVGLDGNFIHWTKHGKLDKVIKRIETPINDIALNDCNAALACWDKSIKIFNYAWLKRVAVLHGHSSAVRSVEYSPSGLHLTSVSIDGQIKLWSAVNGSQLADYSGHSRPVRSIAFSGSANQLITAGEDSRLKVWSGTIGQMTSQYVPDELGRYTCLSVSPNGLYIATGSRDGGITVFHRRDLTRTHQTLCPGESCVNAVKWITVSRFNLTLFAITQNGSLYSVSGIGGPNLFCTKVHTAEVGVEYLSLDGNAKGDLAFTTSTADVYASIDHSYRGILNVKKLASCQTGRISCCAMKTDLLATGSSDGSLVVWRKMVEKRVYEKLYKLEFIHPGGVTSVSWCPDSNDLATAGNDHIKIWQDANKRIDEPTPSFTLTGSEGTVTNICFRSGCVVSTCSQTNTVKVWNKRGMEISTLHLSGPAVGIDMQLEVIKQEKKPDGVNSPDANDWGAYMDYNDSCMEVKIPQHKLRERNNERHDIDVFVATPNSLEIWKPLEPMPLSQYIGPAGALSIATNDNIAVSSFMNGAVKFYRLPNESTAVGTAISHDDIYPITALSYDSDYKCLLVGDEAGNLTAYEDDVIVLKKNMSSVPICGLFQLNKLTVIMAFSDGSLATERLGKVKVMNPLITSSFIMETMKKLKLKLMLPTGGELPEVPLYRMDILPNRGLQLVYPHLVATMNLSGTKDSAARVNKVDVNEAKFNEASDSSALLTTTPLVLQCGKGTYIITGYPTGHISMERTESTEPKEMELVHTGAVTAVLPAQSEGQFFTTSKDGTIKLWNIHLKLVGRYDIGMPITAACVRRNHDSSDVTIIAGDSFGKIHRVAYRS